MAEHLLTLPPASRVNTVDMRRQMRPAPSPEQQRLAAALKDHGAKSDLIESRAAFAEKRPPRFKGWDNPEDRHAFRHWAPNRTPNRTPSIRRLAPCRDHSPAWALMTGASELTATLSERREGYFPRWKLRPMRRGHCRTAAPGPIVGRKCEQLIPTTATKT
jgi:hypothetical protein